MDKKQKYKSLGLPALIISASIINYSKLEGTENVRNIHVATLIVLGMAIGILLRNLIALSREK